MQSIAPGLIPASNWRGDVAATVAKGSFDVKLTPQSPDAAGDEAAAGRMTIDKEFAGDLIATSRGQMLSAMGGVKGSAGYVALERVTGSLCGRNGSFHLQHSGTMTRGAGQLTITVVPDSGTDELLGLSGKMSINIEPGGKHLHEFTYELTT